MGLTSWMVGKATEDILKNTFGITERSKRKHVVREVQKMFKSPKHEPVAYGGAVAVVVALAGAFGLDLTAEQLSVTVSTLLVVGSFFIRGRVTPNKD